MTGVDLVLLAVTAVVAILIAVRGCDGAMMGATMGARQMAATWCDGMYDLNDDDGMQRDGACVRPDPRRSGCGRWCGDDDCATATTMTTKAGDGMGGDGQAINDDVWYVNGGDWRSGRVAMGDG